jgi:hypothetical protein
MVLVELASVLSLIIAMMEMLVRVFEVCIIVKAYIRRRRRRRRFNVRFNVPRGQSLESTDVEMGDQDPTIADGRAEVQSGTVENEGSNDDT